MRAPPLLVLLLAASASACREYPATLDDNLAVVRADEPLQTDQLEYVAVPGNDNGRYTQYGFTVEVVYTNTSDAPVWLGRCYPDSKTPVYGVESIDADESAYDAAWACVGHDEQFRVDPDESRTDVIRIQGPNAWGGCTAEGCMEDDEPHGTLEGRFRLRYDVKLCPDDCFEPVPPELSRSNEFIVRVD